MRLQEACVRVCGGLGGRRSGLAAGRRRRGPSGLLAPSCVIHSYVSQVGACAAGQSWAHTVPARPPSPGEDAGLWGLQAVLLGPAPPPPWAALVCLRALAPAGDLCPVSVGGAAAREPGAPAGMSLFVWFCVQHCRRTSSGVAVPHLCSGHSLVAWSQPGPLITAVLTPLWGFHQEL